MSQGLSNSKAGSISSKVVPSVNSLKVPVFLQYILGMCVEIAAQKYGKNILPLLKFFLL